VSKSKAIRIFIIQHQITADTQDIGLTDETDILDSSTYCKNEGLRAELTASGEEPLEYPAGDRGIWLLGGGYLGKYVTLAIVLTRVGSQRLSM
jgi:hypothetical protein